MNNQHWRKASFAICSALIAAAVASSGTDTANAASYIAAAQQDGVTATDQAAEAVVYKKIDADQVESISYNQSDLMMISLYGDRPEDREKILKLVSIYNHMVDNGSLAAMHENQANSEPLSHFSTGSAILLRDGSYASLTFNFIEDSSIWNTWSSHFNYPQSGQLSVEQAGIGESFRIFGEDGTGAFPLQLFWIPKSPGSQSFSSLEGKNGLYYPNKASLYVGEVPAKFDRYDAQFRIAPFGIAADGSWQAILPGDGELYVNSGSISRSLSFTLQRPENPVIAVDHRLMPDDMQPIIRDDRTFVSVRAASELFGAAVLWDAATKRVDIVRSPQPGNESGEAPGSAAAADNLAAISVWIDGKPLTADVQPFIHDSRVYVPVRAIGEALGAEITYDEQVSLVHIAHP